VTAQKDNKAKKNDFEKALAAYNQAMKLFHQRDFAKSVERLNSFLENYSRERELVDRAKIYRDISQSRLKPEKIKLTTFEDYYQNGVYLLNMGRYDEALESLEKARAKKPSNAKLLYVIADAYCMSGDKDKCLEYLKQAVKLDSYFAILAQNESNFDPVKQDKRFAVITKMA
jgi:tetratricopeptide (TPR) repeat protein